MTSALIEMRGITKTFPGVAANDAVNFEIRSGEIHTLLGENGAGKSTLMKILAGMETPDKGSIHINGRKVRIRSPHDALKLGIGMVYQHFSLIPSLSVLENVILGFEGGMVINRGRAQKRLIGIMKRFNLALNPQKRIRDLSVGERQRLEIVKTLYRGSDLLILDEPTSVLTDPESEALFDTLSSLCDMGKAVVFITHKINEALKVSSRISIMRQGEKVSEISSAQWRSMGDSQSVDHILDLMFTNDPPGGKEPAKKTTVSDVLLEMDRVACRGDQKGAGLNRISLKLHRGEVVGIAGVDGNGQKALAEAVGGQRTIDSGRLVLNGVDIADARGAAARSGLGISYITDECLLEGIAPAMTLGENLILRRYRERPFSKLSVIDERAVNRNAEDLIREFGIKAVGPLQQAGTLSGGNMQKLLLARELSLSPDVIVCNKPTHGLDARTTRNLRRRLMAEARRGAAVLLISTDLDELLECSHRIGVLYNGELISVVQTEATSPAEIGSLMLGGRG